MTPKYQAPPGTLDILPPESARFQALVGQFAGDVERAGYGLYVGPMFEEYAVFERVGETTDIVGREMYDFRDKGDRHLALRPESTPSVVRAFIQHRPTLPLKVWYLAPHFRYNRPQKGRYRQHHSVGIEAVGPADPELDVEVISLAVGFLHGLGLVRFEVDLSSLGDPACRPRYRELLLAYLEPREAGICDQHRAKYRLNPMRLFDCNRDPCRQVTSEAPLIGDHLCDECRDHFTEVQQGLRDLGLTYRLNPRLVRGQDYYTRTTFEFVGLSLEGAQNALGGGGRYDGLVEALGGPPTAGIGFGLGVERILDACEIEDVFTPAEMVLDVFVIDTTGDRHALRLTDELRRAGLRVDRAFDGRSMKAQMKLADRSGARLALLVGADEVGADEVTLRDMRDGEQRRLPRSEVIDAVRKALA